MYKLRRLYLDSIGHRAARFDPLTIDFTAEAQPTDVVLWLRNGGGKTSLLSLFFALLFPNANQFLGRPKKHIRDYVLSEGVGHSVIEWESAPTGLPGLSLPERLVIGAVRFWPSRRWVPDGSPDQYFYAFRSIPDSFTFDDLPFREDRVRVSAQEFRRRLEEVRDRCPACELKIAENLTDWYRVLDSRHLHPRLFEYQRRMNSDEGGAAAFMNFDSGDKFVDLLLDVVLDPASIGSIVGNVAMVREKFEKLPGRRIERDFINSLLQQLEPLRTVRRTERLARSNREALADDGLRLAGRIAASMEWLGQEAQRLGEQARVLAGEERAAANQVNALDRRAAGARLALAALLAKDAARGFEAAKQHEGEAETTLGAWRAAEARMLERELAARQKALDDALRQIEEEGGLRQSYEQAAADYRHALERVLRQISTEIEDAVKERSGCGTRRGEAVRQEREASVLAQDAKRQVTDLKGLLARFEADLAAARDAGLLRNEETPAAALERARAEDSDLGQRVQAAIARRPQVIGRRKDVMAESQRVGAEMARKQAEQVAQRQVRDGFRHRVEEIAADPRVLEIAEHPDVDVIGGHSVLAESLGRLIATGQRDLAGLHLSDKENRWALDWLETPDLGQLPPSRDAEAVIDLLNAAKVSAYPGWRYLRDSVRAEVRELTARRAPHLVSGVVVPEARLGEAMALLVDRQADPQGIVVLTHAAEIDAVAQETGEPSAWRALVTRKALFDPEAIPDEVGRRNQADQELKEQINTLAHQIDGDRRLLAGIQVLARDCPPERLQELDREITVLEEAIALHEKERERWGEALDEVEKDSAGIDEIVRAAGERRRELASAVRTLEDLTRREAEAPEWTHDAKTASDQLTALKARVLEARQAQADSEARAGELDGIASALRERRGELAGSLKQVRSFEVTPSEEEADLDELEQRFEQLRETYNHRVSESQAARDREQVGEHLTAVRSRMTQLSSEVLERCDELLRRNPGMGAAERESKEREVEQTWERRRSEARAAERASNESKDAYESELGSRSARDRATGEIDPQTVEEARSILGVVEAELGQARLEANSLHDAATTAERKAREATGERELLEGHQATLSALGVELEEVPAELDGIAPEDARSAVGDFKQHYSAARRQEGEARQRFEEQAERIRQFSVRTEFNEVTGKLLVLRQLSHDELADEMERQEHDYRARLGELQREIDAFEEDKQLVVGELLEATEGAYDYLGDIARRPLPPNLGDWSGQPFAKMHLERIDRDDLAMRLTHLIEQEIDRKTTRVQVDEMDLLKKAVRAANRNRPFDVKLLKPNTALALERRPASEAQKWSEGERLTAAILVYCTLLGLRSKGAAAEWDTLILDNPFGKANHITLVDLQRKVADAVNIQLVYLTGINDESALSVFGGIVRPYRNMEDARSGHKLVVEDKEPARIYRKVVEAAS